METNVLKFKHSDILEDSILKADEVAVLPEPKELNIVLGDPELQYFCDKLLNEEKFCPQKFAKALLKEEKEPIFYIACGIVIASSSMSYLMTVIHHLHSLDKTDEGCISKALEADYNLLKEKEGEEMAYAITLMNYGIVLFMLNMNHR